MPHLPISVVMIAHREENIIRRSLKPLHGNFAEIILLGQDEKDPTLKIAADELGDKVFVEEWKGYRKQKESATSKASSEWVLSLDADEVLTQEVIEEISQYFQSDSWDWVGARISRKMWFMDRWITHGDSFPDRVLRLYKKNLAQWKGGTVHERIEVKGKVIDLHEPLLHYSYASLHDLHDKMRRYSADFAQDPLKLGQPKKNLEIFIRAFWRGFRSYILRLGFLDGFPGFYLATVHFYSTIYRYGVLQEQVDSSKDRP